MAKNKKGKGQAEQVLNPKVNPKVKYAVYLLHWFAPEYLHQGVAAVRAAGTSEAELQAIAGVQAEYEDSEAEIQIIDLVKLDGAEKLGFIGNMDFEPSLTEDEEDLDLPPKDDEDESLSIEYGCLQCEAVVPVHRRSSEWSGNFCSDKCERSHEAADRNFVQSAMGPRGLLT